MILIDKVISKLEFYARMYVEVHLTLFKYFAFVVLHDI